MKTRAEAQPALLPSVIVRDALIGVTRRVVSEMRAELSRRTLYVRATRLMYLHVTGIYNVPDIYR